MRGSADQPVLLGSWDSARWVVPTAFEVHRVLPGSRGRRRRYAIGSVGTSRGAIEWVAVTLRRRRTWRPDGREAEALLWVLATPETYQRDGRFHVPETGASVGYVVVGDLATQYAKYEARTSRYRSQHPAPDRTPTADDGTSPSWRYFTATATGRDPFDVSRVSFGRTDTRGARYNCQTLLAGRGWQDSDLLVRHHLLGSNDKDLTDLTDEQAAELIAAAVAAGRFGDITTRALGLPAGSIPPGGGRRGP